MGADSRLIFTQSRGVDGADVSIELSHAYESEQVQTTAIKTTTVKVSEGESKVEAETAAPNAKTVEPDYQETPEPAMPRTTGNVPFSSPQAVPASRAADTLDRSSIAPALSPSISALKTKGMPVPVLLRTPNASPPNSTMVEPPEEPAQPSSVPSYIPREETPVDFPDPKTAPPDAELVPAFSPGELHIDPLRRSPSLIVEPPPDIPEFASVPDPMSRAESPIVLPDPELPPPDATVPLPLSPGQVLHHPVYSPSLVVEPPMDQASLEITRVEDADIGDTSMGVSHDVSESEFESGRHSDHEEGFPADHPWSASADTDTADTLPINISPPNKKTADIPGDEEVQTRPVHTIPQAAEEGVAETTEFGKVDDDSRRPGLQMTESMRLRHHHGGIARSDVLGPSEVRTVHHARSRTESAGISPPVTRSHCFYRKLKLVDDDLSALVLVPQCTLFEYERLEMETSEDLGEATSEEETEAGERAMTTDEPLLHPRLELKLHRIVGNDIFEEGHCFLLSAPENSRASAVRDDDYASTPRPTGQKRSWAELEGEIAPDDGSGSPAIETKTAKRHSQLAPPATVGTPSKSPLRESRRLARSTSKAAEGSPGEVHSELGDSPATRTRQRTRRSTSVLGNNEDRRSMRQGTDTSIDTVNPTTPVKSSRRGGRKSVKKAEPVVVEETFQEEEEAAIAPTTKMGGSTPPKTRSAARRAARDDDLYRPEDDNEVDSDAGDIPVPHPPPMAGEARSTNGAENEEGMADLDFEQDLAPGSHSSRKRQSRRSSKRPSSVGGPVGNAIGSKVVPTMDHPSDDETLIQPSSPPATRTRKRKARLSSPQGGKADIPGQAQDLSEGPIVKDPRSPKRRAVSTEDDLIVTVAQSDGADAQLAQDNETPVAERRARTGWFRRLWRR
jgi:hypothetical protein